MMEKKKVNARWEFSASLVTLVHRALIVGVPSPPSAVVHTLDDVSEPLLPLVIPLDHEVGQVRDERASEPSRTSGEVDELLVLGPFRL